MHFDAAVAPNVDGALNAVEGVQAFFNAIVLQLPTAVKLNVENAVEVIEETTGQLVETFSVAAQTQISGTGNSTYSGVSGACISWNTGEVRNGRRVRGRTFIIPLHTQVYEGDGTLTTGCITALSTAAQGLIDHTSDFHIFNRPTLPGAADGQSATVTGFVVKDKAAVLRSRRD